MKLHNGRLICDICYEPLKGHIQPFTNELRSCDMARLYRDCPNPIFCRYPEACSKTPHKCMSIEKYDRACND